MTLSRTVSAVVAAAFLGLAACAPTADTLGGPTGAVGPRAAFNEADFAWSAAQGSAAIDGRVTFRQNGRAFDCTGSVALTPDTPYTRARFQTLYGSTERASLPEAVVRARTVPDPNADYRRYVRSGVCDGGRFRIEGLPNGSWFLIVPVSAAGTDERVVLMRRVQTVGGRTAQITL